MQPSELGFMHIYEPAAVPGLSTLLLLHGTGGDEHDLLPLGRALLPGAGLLSPRGKVLERGMPRYFRRLREGVFDREDVVFRAGELARFVGEAAQAYGFEAGNVVGAGFSNGANIAAAVLLLHPGVLRRAVLLHAQLPLEPDEAPDLLGTGVFMGSGRADPLVPVAETERLAQTLRGYGATVDLHWQPGGHNLSAAEVQEARRWLLEG